VSCLGVRYARIDSGANYLQISQLAVYNVTGGNVAKYKNTIGSAALVSCSYSTSGAVDGVLVAKAFLDCSYNKYHSFVTTGSYWQVDLGSSQTISKVVYYNRADSNFRTRATTYSLTLLDNSNKTMCMCNSFTSDFVQDLALTLGIIR